LPRLPKQHIDGVSMLPLLKGGQIEREPLFWHYPHYGNQGGAPCGAIREGDWKLIEWYEDSSLELYNLKDDIGESKNLVQANPSKADALKGKLVAWRKEVNAVMPTPNTEPAQKGKGKGKKQESAEKRSGSREE
jgi:arylsulfatase A-like enzyme